MWKVIKKNNPSYNIYNILLNKTVIKYDVFFISSYQFFSVLSQMYWKKQSVAFHSYQDQENRRWNLGLCVFAWALKESSR